MLRQNLGGGFTAGPLETGMQFGPTLAQMGNRTLDLFLPFAEICLDLRLVSEVKVIAPYTCSKLRDEKF